MVWLIMLLVFVFGTVTVILTIGVLAYCLRKKLKNGTKGGLPIGTHICIDIGWELQ